MASDSPEDPPGADARAGEAGDRASLQAASGDAPRSPLGQRVTVPEPVVGYFHRSELMAECLPTNRRVTLLKAPGGFGKTTLLAECCRTLLRQGVVTAWLSVDEQDDLEMLDTYLAFAFQRAGLDILHPPGAYDREAGVVAPRTRQLLLAIEARARPVVLALDEVERLPGPASVAILNLLLERGPSNLHLAIACRELPVGLQVATSVLEGEAAILTADDLRFSRSEIAGFFEAALTRRELADLTADSAGWPIALRIYQNERQSGSRWGTNRMTDLAENWVESRLWRGMSEEERELVLDVGLFEWVDAELLDEVLEGRDLWARLEAKPALAGLLQPVQGQGADTRRLHPLLREYCVGWRRRETPERFQMVHLRIATVLAGRGSVVTAMRHATDGRDPVLVGAILLEAGGVRVGLRDGVARLRAADRFLTPAILEQYPRLAFAHCFVLITAGKLEEARRVYESTARRTRDFTGGHGGYGDRNLYLEHAQLLGLTALYGCAPVGSDQMVAAVERLAIILEQPDLDPLFRSSFEVGLCIAHSMRAEFDVALERARRARAAARDRSTYLAVHIDYQVGQMAMAQGRVRKAADCYARGRRLAQAGTLGDPEATGIGDVLMRELELERDRLPSPRGPIRMPAAFHEHGTPLQVYAAASGTVVDLTLQQVGTDGALAAVEGMLEYTNRAGLPAATRYLSALRVSTLAAAGRVEGAERAWRRASLPGDADGCLDLGTLSWREMEAIACARLRLLHARADVDEARRFGTALVSVCQRRGLRRTWMRCLAHSLAMESACGDGAAATRHLVEFLCLFEETDYARPLVREGQSSLELLESYLETDDPEPATRATAITLLQHLRKAPVGRSGNPALSAREAQILERLEHRSDNEIAVALGLSHAGVRYHIHKIFSKLGARSRLDAVHRARRRGLLPAA